jgi:hypothetical protein
MYTPDQLEGLRHTVLRHLDADLAEFGVLLSVAVPALAESGVRSYCWPSAAHFGVVIRPRRVRCAFCLSLYLLFAGSGARVFPLARYREFDVCCFCKLPLCTRPLLPSFDTLVTGGIVVDGPHPSLRRHKCSQGEPGHQESQPRPLHVCLVRLGGG